MTDQELKDLVAGLAIAQQNNEIQFARTDAQMAKTDMKIAELIEQQKKTSSELGTLQNNEIQFVRTDAKMIELIEQQKKTSSELGTFGRGRGEIAEEFFYRSLSKKPQVGNINFDNVYRNWRHGIGKISDEYDVILVNGDCLLIVEVKARADKKDIWKLVKTKIPNFRLLFPTYKNYKLLGAIASLTSSDKLIAKAKELGVFFLTQHGEHITLVNDEVKIF